jgi:hypothetical protein
VKFDQNYSKYRDNKNAHFKSLQSNLQTNLENRHVEVERTVNPNENIKDTLKHFNELRERKKNAVLIQRTSTTMCGIPFSC